MGRQSLDGGETLRDPASCRPPRCGPLGCTLMHETTHMIGKLQRANAGSSGEVHWMQMSRHPLCRPPGATSGSHCSLEHPRYSSRQAPLLDLRTSGQSPSIVKRSLRCGVEFSEHELLFLRLDRNYDGSGLGCYLSINDEGHPFKITSWTY